MTEKAIVEGLQDVLQAMSEFDNDEVLINDFAVLDQTMSGGRRVIFETSDDFRSLQNTSTPNTFWSIKLWLVEVFDGWETTLNAIRDGRQAIIDQINSDDHRSANGIEATTVNELRSQTPILPWFDPFLDPELYQEAEPLYLYQIFILETE